VREKFQERGIRQRGPLGVASENGGKIEAEAVDMVFRRPVAEAVDNEFANGGVVAVNGVSAARVVCEGALLVENIPGFVIDAAEGEDGSISTAFGRVIKKTSSMTSMPDLWRAVTISFISRTGRPSRAPAA